DVEGTGNEIYVGPVGGGDDDLIIKYIHAARDSTGFPYEENEIYPGSDHESFARAHMENISISVVPRGDVEKLVRWTRSGFAPINRDIAPTKISQRTWGTYNIAALWIGMSVCIPTYMLSSGLIAGGMNWWQAILTIALGNVIVLIPMILNAHAGTRYGIPFPVLARASFGTLGSNIPALMRALVACGWFGIQTWIGGQAIHAMLSVLWPAWGASRFGPWTSFAIFWLINIAVIIRGIESIK